MTKVDEALQRGGLRWSADDDRWNLVSDGDTLGWMQGDRIEIGDRVMRLRHDMRRHLVLEDVARESSIAMLRVLPYNVGVVHMGSQRFRIAREGVLPFFWKVTADINGPQLLRVARFGSSVRFRPASGLESARDVDLAVLVVLVAAMFTASEEQQAA